MTELYNNIRSAPGVPIPLGTNVFKNGVQFSIFSRNAEAVSLLLFESEKHDSKFHEIILDPHLNKTGDIWHIWLEGIKEGQIYGYTLDGPFAPDDGHRFNKNKLIIDPYARALTNGKWNLANARDEYDPKSGQIISLNKKTIQDVPRGVVINNKVYTSHKPLNIEQEDSIIYELHVKGFTHHHSSGVGNRGSFMGLTEKIPYLKDLGVTSVELMPIMEFDEYDNIFTNPITGEKLKNFWGYNTLAFFAPKAAYSSKNQNGEQYHEFKQMVKTFHEAGIEIILDVVFNHTAEGDERGPTLSFKGIDNSIYYILDYNKRHYMNYSGCGNTVNCNHPFVRDFILECLRYWVVEMHVDGFRFDLASILGRDTDGQILGDPPLIERIEEDPILRNTKIIAEAWDAAGAYQVGHFPGRWAEWNGKYRDDVRRFWNGDKSALGSFTTRLTGSSDLYNRAEKGPLHSINFVTCHDGFTLNDLVSFKNKHNTANGENNRDGESHNISNNFGVEGLDAPEEIDKIRAQQIKNFLTTLFISQGIPMLLAGDEFRRTQNGNNNSYCQDNEISWVDWTLMEKNVEIFRFTKKIIQFRKDHHIFRKTHFFHGDIVEGHNCRDLQWFNHLLEEPNWHHGDNSIAMLICGEYAEEEYDQPDSDIYAIFNSSMDDIDFKIPESPSGRKWKIAINTGCSYPADIYNKGEEPEIKSDSIIINKLSTIVLIA